MTSLAAGVVTDLALTGTAAFLDLLEDDVIEVVLTLAKTAATIAEAATLDDTPVPDRFIRVLTSSTELAEAATPYRYDRQGAFRLFERAEGEIGGNATIILTYRAFYDSTLTYAYRAVVVNQLTALP